MSLRGSLFSAAQLVVIAGIACVGRADVLVVAPSGAPYSQIGLAVDAAHDGDVVLVRAGSYAGVFVANKSVTIIGEAGADIRPGAILITDISASQQVTIAGLRSASTGGSLECSVCDGPVRIVDSTFGGETFTTLNYPPLPTVYVTACRNVAFISCRIEGAEDAQHGGSQGMNIRESVVSLFNTIVRGGRGPDGDPWFMNGVGNGPGREGLEGIDCRSSTLFVSGCRITGGRGGPGLNGVCGNPVDAASAGGSGGLGLFAWHASFEEPSTVRLLDNAMQGGLGGLGGANACASAPNGSPGGGYASGSSAGIPQIEVMPGTARSMSPIACASEGGALHVSFRGLPGDRTYLGISTGSSYAYVPSLHGPLLVLDLPLRAKFIGVLDAGGFLETHLPVTELGPGVQAIVRQAQGILVGANGSKWLTGSSPMVRLDAAF